MKITKTLIALALLTVLLLTACGGSDTEATPTPMDDTRTMAESDMVDEPDMDDEMMDDAGAAEMDADETMDEPDAGADEMMEEPDMDADDMMDDADVGEDEMMDEKESAPTLNLSFTGLEDLGPGWVYEGWLIVDSEPHSSGRFTVDAEGMLSHEAFDVDPMLVSKATAFVLTIEPEPDPDPAPSPVHLLGGGFMEDAAELSLGHPAALGTDLMLAGGNYILGIPTSDSADDAYQSGIWFTGLDLPQLPDAWVYEGWVVGPDGPMSTGRFTGLKEADSDGAGPTAGPKAGPAFPGQDYIKPPIDLTAGYAAVISVEPEPDNSPAPFVLKPLVDMTIEDVGDHVPQSLENNSASAPSGKATRQPMDAAEMNPEADMMEEEMAVGPDWFQASLTDVNSGESFMISDFYGQVVLVETLATWCPKCLSQQKEVKALHEALGERPDFVSLGLSVDPNEDAEFLQAYTAKHGFDWLYAIAPTEVAREIGQLYGDQFLNPPSTPMLIIDRQGEVHPLPFGNKSADRLQQQVEMYLNEGP